MTCVVWQQDASTKHRDGCWLCKLAYFDMRCLTTRCIEFASTNGTKHGACGHSRGIRHGHCQKQKRGGGALSPCLREPQVAVRGSSWTTRDPRWTLLYRLLTPFCVCFAFQNVPNQTEKHQYLQYSSPCWFRVLPVVSNYLTHTRNPPNSTWLIFNQSSSLRKCGCPRPNGRRSIREYIPLLRNNRKWKKQNPAEVDEGLFLL